MGDIIDDGNKTADLFLDVAMRNRVQQVHDTPRATGQCLACGDDVPDERRWCDAACRDEWEKDQKRRGRS